MEKREFCIILPREGSGGDWGRDCVQEIHKIFYLDHCTTANNVTFKSIAKDRTSERYLYRLLTTNTAMFRQQVLKDWSCKFCGIDIIAFSSHFIADYPANQWCIRSMIDLLDLSDHHASAVITKLHQETSNQGLQGDPGIPEGPAPIPIANEATEMTDKKATNYTTSARNSK